MEKIVKRIKLFLLMTMTALFLMACSDETNVNNEEKVTENTIENNYNTDFTGEEIVNLNDIPEFTENAWVEINGNVPYFEESEFTEESFEYYSELDELGRCGVAYACIGRDLMPTEERGQIGSVKPTGWHTVKYDIVDGKYLYNRCHLIGFQLTGENAENRNLITGTRFLNVNGMLLFENMVADYIKETKNHLLYRVTPVFDGDNLVANGVLMEALSMEDNGDGICFNVYVYNNQPGVEIDYTTGESWLSGREQSDNESNKEEKYVLNTNSKKIHLPSCESALNISEDNMEISDLSKEELIEQGYSACGNCKP